MINEDNIIVKNFLNLSLPRMMTPVSVFGYLIVLILTLCLVKGEFFNFNRPRFPLQFYFNHSLLA